ncbi:hypothetical protein AAES_83466 [Amazona aestiva]|uniref:Transmembrane protein 131-like N-terminal domain-containing protein n=1 Tax=Amazona aestiva TaxID=12930 RepID=A0A0Q3PKG2_AMAAE|nr:hypothetical protein AAES_83466 [Amazona aestiva]
MYEKIWKCFSAKMPPNGKALHFHPSVLHFGMQLLGLPRAKMLHAYNPSRDKEVVVNSVFTATRQFHVSPAHSRVIPTMGKISFRVLFLPTEEGSIESSLFINTSSHGVLSYQNYRLSKFIEFLIQISFSFRTVQDEHALAVVLDPRISGLLAHSVGRKEDLCPNTVNSHYVHVAMQQWLVTTKQ